MLKPSVFIQNFANPLLFSGASEGFGKKEALNGFFIRGLMDYMPKVLFNWKAAADTREFVYSKSQFMYDRMKNPDYSLHELTQKMFGKGNKLNDFGVALMAETDNLTNIPMWLEAYNNKLEQTGNEYEAVKYADNLIDND